MRIIMKKLIKKIAFGSLSFLTFLGLSISIGQTNQTDQSKVEFKKNQISIPFANISRDINSKLKDYLGKRIIVGIYHLSKDFGRHFSPNDINLQISNGEIVGFQALQFFQEILDPLKAVNKVTSIDRGRWLSGEKCVQFLLEHIHRHGPFSFVRIELSQLLTRLGQKPHNTGLELGEGA